MQSLSLSLSLSLSPSECIHKWEREVSGEEEGAKRKKRRTSLYEREEEEEEEGGERRKPHGNGSFPVKAIETKFKTIHPCQVGSTYGANGVVTAARRTVLMLSALSFYLLPSRSRR